jgi:RNA polymerase sigma factor (sigma-70 family)
MAFLSSSGESFEEICNPLRDELYNFAKKLTRSAAAAEDVVQDSLLYAWRAWPRWDSQGAADPALLARAWLYRIVSNVFTDLARGTSRRRQLHKVRAPEIAEGLYGEAVELPACSTPTPLDSNSLSEERLSRPNGPLGLRALTTIGLAVAPEALDHASQDTVTDEVLAAVRRLRQPYQKWVELHYFMGWSQQEVADECGRGLGTVSSGLSRAREMLRPLLASFASANYGLSGEIRIDTRVKPTQVVQPQTDGIDGVVGQVDPVALVLRQAAPYYAAAG